MTVATLPPGPGPAPLNMLGWVMRPIPFMEHARRRFGDRFTVDMGRGSTSCASRSSSCSTSAPRR